MIPKNPKSSKTGQAKRLETLETKTEKQKLEFLGHLAKSSIVQLACERSGIGRSTYYDWRNKDEGFAEVADKAIKVGVLVINDMAESHLIHNIQNNSNTAIIFWLKNHHELYNDKMYHKHEIVEPKIDPEQQIAIAKALFNSGQFTKFGRDEMIRSAGGIPPNVPGEEESMNEVIRQAEEGRLKRLKESRLPSKARVIKNTTPPQITEQNHKPRRGGINIAEFVEGQKKKEEERKRLEGK